MTVAVICASLTVVVVIVWATRRFERAVARNVESRDRYERALVRARMIRPQAVDPQKATRR